MSRKEWGLVILCIILAFILLYWVNIDINNQEKLRKIDTNLKNKEYKEVSLIARVINQEVTGCGDIDKVLTASSILNRVDDAAFKGNIYDVIYTPNQYTISDTFTKDDFEIALCVWDNIVRDCNVLYFHTPSSNAKHSRNIRKTKKLIHKSSCHEYY